MVSLSHEGALVVVALPAAREAMARLSSCEIVKTVAFTLMVALDVHADVASSEIRVAMDVSSVVVIGDGATEG
jgi:hypothetical protein